MCKLVIMKFTLLVLLTISCNDASRVQNKTQGEAETRSNYIASVIFLNGSDLEFKKYSRGCFHEETQRIQVSKKDNQEIVVSYFKNDIKVLDKKVFDSSFQIYIKSFIYECDQLLKDTTSSIVFESGKIETIQISDGLDIIEVSAGKSQYRNPFDDLTYIICLAENNKMKM
jgi:hypothetical protein